MIHEGRQGQGESQFTLEPAEPGIRQCTRDWRMPGPKLLYSSGQSQGSAIVASPLPSGRWVDSALLFALAFPALWLTASEVQRVRPTSTRLPQFPQANALLSNAARAPRRLDQRPVPVDLRAVPEPCGWALRGQ